MKAVIQFFSLVLVFGFAARIAHADPIAVVPRCPYTITKPGTYVLTSDMKCTTYDKSAIVIQGTQNVQLKLNGHTITGTIDPKFGGPAAIFVKDSSAVMIDGAAATIKDFSIGLEMQNVNSFSLRNPTNSPLTLLTKSGIRYLSGKTVLISSVVMPSITWYGYTFSSVDGLGLYNTSVNQGAQAGYADTGMYLSGVTNSRVSGFAQSKSIKGVQIQVSKNIKIDNFQVLNKSTFEALNLNQNENITFTNVNLSASHVVGVLGDNPGVTFNGGTLTSYLPGSEVCWWGDQPAKVPVFANISPANLVIKKCVQ